MSIHLKGTLTLYEELVSDGVVVLKNKRRIKPSNGVSIGQYFLRVIVISAIAAFLANAWFV